MQRAAVKSMLREWEVKFPGRAEAIFSSIRHVSPSQLADPALFDFGSLAASVADVPASEAVTPHA
jgi:tRNA 2-thiocytidine biosynthesis protein TtcA